MSVVALLLLIAKIAMMIPDLIKLITYIMDLIGKLPRRGQLRHEARGKLGAILKRKLAQHAEKGLVNADETELEALRLELIEQVKAGAA